jgi:uncharacterized membrane protein YccC
MAIMDVLRDAGAWRQGMRTGFAGAAAYLLAASLALPQGYWAVITAVLITQQTVGATLQAVRDRLVGTIAGAVIGFLMALATPSGEWGTLVALGLSTGMLAVCAVHYPSLRIAPMTAAIMLVAAPSHADVMVSALHRVLEIVLGCLVGIGITLLVFPRRAETLLRADVADVLSLLARYLVADGDASPSLDLRLDEAFGRLATLGKQASAEHFGRDHDGRLDAQGADHALRQLRIAVTGLRRAAARLPPGTPLPATLAAAGDAVHTSILGMAAELGAGGAAAGGRDRRAAAHLPTDDQIGLSAAGDAHAEALAMSYGAAYAHARLALEQLRSAILGRVAPVAGG